MIQTLQTRRSPRLLAWALSALMLGPILVSLTGCGNKSADTSSNSAAPSQPADTTTPVTTPTPATATPPAPKKQGMSNGKKAVIILAGAALLYYLYKKHQAAQAGTQGGAVQPQLYRSSNGGVYYRDPKDPQKVTWLTAPSQPVSVPASDVQQYAPDYQQYQGKAAPAVPAGQPQQSFTQYDPSLAGSQSEQ